MPAKRHVINAHLTAAQLIAQSNAIRKKTNKIVKIVRRLRSRSKSKSKSKSKSPLNNYRKLSLLPIDNKRPAINAQKWIGLTDLPKNQLNPHQKDAVCAIVSGTEKGQVLIYGTGSGKTKAALVAAAQYGGAVIICPATLISNWKNEIKKWSIPGKFKIMSYQAFHNDPVNLKGQFVIIDEAHFYRNAIGKFPRLLLTELRRAHKVLFLTATPLYNQPYDISALVNPLLPSRATRLPTTALEYEHDFGKHPERFAEKLKNYVIYYKPKDDYQNYPKVQERTLTVIAKKHQQELYKALEEKNITKLLNLSDAIKERVGEISGKNEDKIKKIIKGLTTYAVTARQIANQSNQDKTIDAAKVTRIMDFLTLHKNAKKRVLIFSQFLAGGLYPIRDQLERHGIKFGLYTGQVKNQDRDALVKSYNSGKIRILLLSSAGGEGLDLKNTDFVVILEPHWNNQKAAQAIGRAARFQSHKPNSTVKVIHFITKFPDAKMKGIELAMTKIAADKQVKIDAVMSHLAALSDQVVKARRKKCGI